MAPTLFDIAHLAAEHYGISVQEVFNIMRTPTHPKTLRDEFAMAALAHIPRLGTMLKETAQLRYVYVVADAMLKVRLEKIVEGEDW